MSSSYTSRAPPPEKTEKTCVPLVFNHVFLFMPCSIFLVAMLTTVPCPVHPGEVLLASVQVQDLNPIAIHWTWHHMSCVCFSLAKLQYTNWDTYVGPTQTTPMRNCREGYLSSLSAYAVASAKSIIWKKH